MTESDDMLQQALGDQYALERGFESLRLELLRLRAGVGSPDAVHRALDPVSSAAPLL